jgi:uncharacterized protein (TIGR02246 family)
MASSNREMEVTEIQQLIQRLNDAWAKGNPSELANFFREDIVMVNPDFSQRTEGREACVASYEGFCKQAAMLDLKIGEAVIDVFNDTAIASYSWEIAYEMGGEHFNDTGRDIFLFVREDGKWLAVWRTMIVPQSESIN